MRLQRKWKKPQHHASDLWPGRDDVSNSPNRISFFTDSRMSHPRPFSLLSVCVCLNGSVSLCVCLRLCPSAFVSVCVFLCLPVFSSVCHCLFVCLCFCLCVLLCQCLSVYVFICLFSFVCGSFSVCFLSLCLSPRLFLFDSLSQISFRLSFRQFCMSVTPSLVSMDADVPFGWSNLRSTSFDSKEDSVDDPRAPNRRWRWWWS